MAIFMFYKLLFYRIVNAYQLKFFGTWDETR